MKPQKSRRLFVNLSILVVAVGIYFGVQQLSKIWHPFDEHPARPAALVDFTLEQYPSGTISLNSLLGKEPILIHFWASWCQVCRQERPVINELLQQATKDQFTVLGIANSDDHKALTIYQKQIPVHELTAVDPEGTVAKLYKIQGIPQSILVDKTGKILMQFFRPLDYEDIKTISRLVQEAKRPDTEAQAI